MAGRRGASGARQRARHDHAALVLFLAGQAFGAIDDVPTAATVAAIVAVVGVVLGGAIVAAHTAGQRARWELFRGELQELTEAYKADRAKREAERRGGTPEGD